MQCLPPDPYFSFSWLFRPPSALPAPLDRANVSFFSFGRAALAAGLNLLGLNPGDNVLLPSFVCDVLMAPFVELSIEVRFYRLDAMLQPDLEHARTLLDERTRALTAANYFGFAPDLEAIRSFCTAHGLYFIEDNAHGFMGSTGGRALGTFGDISIVSFRKILGTIDGAALIVNAPNLCDRPVNSVEFENAINPALNLARSALATVSANSGIDVLTTAQRIYDGLFNDKAMARNNHAPRKVALSIEGHRQRCSKLSQAIMRRAPAEEIIRRHREGFEVWQDWFESNRLDGVHPLFDELAPGIVPLAFPVVGANFERIGAILKQHHIGARQWPACLPHRSPGWDFFEKVLLLPVHHPVRLPS